MKKSICYTLSLISYLMASCAPMDKSIRTNETAAEEPSTELKYKEIKNPYLLAEEPMHIRNGVHSMSLLSNGRFSMGTERGEEKLDLIYGHPNGAFSDGIWSSYTSISVEGSIFKFDKLENKKINKVGDSLELTAKVPGYPVIVLMKLIPKSSNGFYFHLTAKNEGNIPLYIAFRLLLDTWAGRSDGVPFILPGLSQGIDSVYTNEVKFSPTSSPAWETFDPNEPRTGFLRTSLIGEEINPPNRVALVNWGLAFISDWEYEVDKENPVSGDSAVLSWWDPLLIHPNGLREGSILFESKERSDGIFFVPENKKGNGFLYLARENTTDSIQKRSYQLSVENGSYFSNWKEGKMEYEMKPQSYLYRMIPVTVSGVGDTKLQIQETVNGQVESHIFSIILPAEIASVPAVWDSNRKFPFRFVSEQKDRKLKGRILDSNNIKQAEVPLRETKFSTHSVYEGEIEINFDGEIFSEIVEED
ncbi:hypothetical protein EHQ58_12135 [Leptospira ognonensis]|uniref:Uncharacterized protein n=1 Tax=Leptospira ognonensis TaxID=2484945 RepID=A0A4R9K1Y2_9LEPT|nr:hypothetical protein [Leptospira ognonensis]TGL58125.1 hypothetical protein EHQ58_12135 [Leptospira ognonensis]